MVKSAKDLQITAIVMFNNGAFGGAPKRITNLFLYLNKLYPQYFYLFVNSHLYNQIRNIYDNLPEEFIKIVDLKEKQKGENKSITTNSPQYYSDNIPDPLEVDKQYTIVRKLFWFYKNKFLQYQLFKQIEKLRNELDIKVFYAVFSGVLPLVFYMNKDTRKVRIIFADMDSWFTDVLKDMKKLWYRKYYSFNYALEKCDLIDFLSPYIYEGVKNIGIKIDKVRVRIAPCSFIDYSKCSVGEKKNFEIAFCGRLEPDKNPMLYLHAAKEILQKFPQVKFHILGEGTLVNEINSFINTNSLTNNINFSFHKNPPEIFKDTSVFVSLQSNTNYPSQSVLEAMACGNAVIASDVGDTRLFLNNENSILIKLNLNELTSSLEKLITHQDIAHNMGKIGREYIIHNHTIEKYAEYFLELLK